MSKAESKSSSRNVVILTKPERKSKPTKSDQRINLLVEQALEFDRVVKGFEWVRAIERKNKNVSGVAYTGRAGGNAFVHVRIKFDAVTGETNVNQWPVNLGEAAEKMAMYINAESELDLDTHQSSDALEAFMREVRRELF